MIIFFLFIDILILFIIMASLFYAFKLWVLLGRHGLVTWLVLAMVYAIPLRSLSLCADIGMSGALFNYTRILALPLYIFLLLGFWGLFQQVDRKLKNEPNPVNWLRKLLHRNKRFFKQP